MATSAIGVFAPLLVKQVVSKRVSDISFAVIKQFGTGVIISAALIHVSETLPWFRV